MRVEMRVQIAGTRDGVEWPAPGDTIVVPDDEGAELCAAGFAVPVKGTGTVETADAPKAPARKRSSKAKA